MSAHARRYSRIRERRTRVRGYSPKRRLTLADMFNAELDRIIARNAEART